MAINEAYVRYKQHCEKKGLPILSEFEFNMKYEKHRGNEISSAFQDFVSSYCPKGIELVPDYSLFRDWCQAHDRWVMDAKEFDSHCSRVKKLHAEQTARDYLESFFRDWSVTEKWPCYETYVAGCRSHKRYTLSEKDLDSMRNSWKERRRNEINSAFNGFVGLHCPKEVEPLPGYTRFSTWCQTHNRWVVHADEFDSCCSEAEKLHGGRSALEYLQSCFGAETSPKAGPDYQDYVAWCRARNRYILTESDLDKVLDLRRNPTKSRKSECRTCQGEGNVTTTGACPTCSGKGLLDTGIKTRRFMGEHVISESPYMSAPIYKHKPVYTYCRQCLGTGRASRVCDSCGGLSYLE